MRRFFLLILLGNILYASPALSAEGPIKTVDSISNLIRENAFCQGTYSRELVAQLRDISLEYPDNDYILAFSLYGEALVDFAQGSDNALLLNRIDSALACFSRPDDSFEKALLLYTRSIANRNHSDYAGAFRDGINALSKFKALGQEEFIVWNLVSLGSLCMSIANFNLSDVFHSEALELAPPYGYEYYRIKANQGYSYLLQGQYETSIDSLETLIKEAENAANLELIIAVYLNLGANYGTIGQRKKSYEYYSRLLELTEGVDNRKVSLALYQNLGSYYYDMKQYDLSYKWLKKAQKIAVENNYIVHLSTVLRNLYNTFEAMPNPDSAFYYLKKYKEVVEIQLDNNKKIVGVYQSYVNTLLESSEHKLIIAEQELLLKKKQITQTIIYAVIAILLIVFFLIISIQKRRNVQQSALIKEMENKDLSERLEQEQKIKELQTEKLEDSLREATSYSLLLSNNKHVLNKILKYVEQIPDGNAVVNKLTSKITKVIKSNLNIEHDWEAFILHFKQVHPSFFEKLQSGYPELTNNDIKLCAYFRIGLSVKEISRILSISPESVRTNRYRLRKKLFLNDDENLDDFINSL